jgi:hypothetical protein
MSSESDMDEKVRPCRLSDGCGGSSRGAGAAKEIGIGLADTDIGEFIGGGLIGKGFVRGVGRSQRILNSV